MDMSRSYSSAVKETLPHIDIIFDKFHVVALANKALNTVRKEHYAKLSEDNKKIIKGKKFLLLKNNSSLNKEQTDQLHELLKVNQPIFIAYTLKEQLKLFWDCNSASEATNFISNWIDSARSSNLEPLKKLADTLEKHFYGLVTYFKHKISNGFAEGLNNKIKTMKRQAYGFRDMKYFKLRLYHLHKSGYRLCG